MPVTFTIGHVGGTTGVNVPPAAVEKRLAKFLEELYEADDHFARLLKKAGAAAG